MKRALKLSLYYYGYQLLFTALLVFPMNLAKVFQNGEATTSMNTETNVDLNYITGIAMVLSGIMMIWLSLISVAKSSPYPTGWKTNF